MIYDLIIIGGGPAGVSAGVYSARKQLKTLLITPEFGGQSIVSEGIENWIGTIKLSGSDLAKNLENHLKAYAGDFVEIKNESAENISKSESVFEVKTEKSTYQSKSVLIATGSHRRKLEIPGAKEFDNKGIIYCASCDGPLFAGQDVVVIGGGNAALETSAQLLSYCKSVTLLNRSDKLRGDEITISKLSENSHFKIIKNAVPVEVLGDKFVSGLIYEDTVTKEKHTLTVPAIFVEIGLLPTTYFAKNIIKLNEYNQIPINPKDQQTEVYGIWAAGDCTDAMYHQNNIASGDAVRALEDIYVHIKTK
ncbi:MAG: FAD-dependent oxidoreductase [Candidatus Paceibacterota bacterium]